jgi:hypothetical protein
MAVKFFITLSPGAKSIKIFLSNELNNVQITAVKSFITLNPGACIIKLIMAVIYGFRNKLECLSLASLSSLI